MRTLVKGSSILRGCSVGRRCALPNSTLLAPAYEHCLKVLLVHACAYRKCVARTRTTPLSFIGCSWLGIRNSLLAEFGDLGIGETFRVQDLCYLDEPKRQISSVQPFLSRTPCRCGMGIDVVIGHGFGNLIQVSRIGTCVSDRSRAGIVEALGNHRGFV